MLLTVAVALGGCAALPSQVERPVSFARSDVADTGLAKIAAASTPPRRARRSPAFACWPTAPRRSTPASP